MTRRRPDKPQLSPNGREALSYAKAGYEVVPVCWPIDGKCGCGRGCRTPGKAPLTPHGHKDGTTNPEAIKEYWRRWPDGGVAIVLNEARGDVLVDIDPRNGGGKSWPRLIEVHGRLPRTPKAKTGGGGRHFLLDASAQPVRNRVGKGAIAPGVEVKTKGLFVVSPSLHASGQRYEWEIDPRTQKPAPIPDWLESLANANASAENLDGYDEPGVIEEGARNDAVTSHAGWLLATGMPSNALSDALIGFNRRVCKPPLDDSEVLSVAASIAATDRRNHPERYEDSDWLDLDFTAPQPDPDWAVVGVLERGAVTIVSADTGVGKSLFAAALVADVVSGRSFLGQHVHARRAMVIDCENPKRVTIARLRGLMLGGDVKPKRRERILRRANQLARGRLRLRVRSGLVDIPHLEREVLKFRPDILVVDTILAGFGIDDINSNTEAARVMRSLRRLAADHQVAIVLLHHESKPSKDRPRGRAFETMGARSWVGQADGLIRLEPRARAREDLGEGRRRLRTEVVLTVPKTRDGVPLHQQIVVFEGEYDEAGHLLWLSASTDDAGPSDSPGARLLQQIVEVLDDRGPLRQIDLAKALGVERNQGTFTRALKTGRQRGVLAQEDGRGGRYYVRETVDGP